MGLFRTKEQRQMQKITQDLKLITGYAPVFSNFSGGLYELELTRSAIDTIATQCSKLNPVCNKKKFSKLLNQPNSIMTVQQFLYRLVTILYCENNAYIVPIYDNYGDQIKGFYPVRSNGSSIVTYNNKEYLKYKIGQQEFAEEYSKVGHIRRFYYSKEYFGENNSALHNTLELINTQNQGIINGIKMSACIRFLGKLSTVMKPDDIVKEQKRLKEENLGSDNNGGILLFDSRYSDIKQVDSKPFIIDDKQNSQIRNNVFDYFHLCEEIMQNKADENQWNSFYEGCVEPVALQLSQVCSKLLGCDVVFESSRMQFANNTTKLNVSTQLFDRGVLTTNQIMDIWNMPHVEDGDKRYIRREYAEIKSLENPFEVNEKEDNDGKSNTTSKSGESETNGTKENSNE